MTKLKSTLGNIPQGEATSTQEAAEPSRTYGIDRSFPHLQSWDAPIGTASGRATGSPGELPWNAEPGGQGNAKGALGKWQIHTQQAQKLVKMLLKKADVPKREDKETSRKGCIKA